MTHGTRHEARPNLDDNVPQACSGTRNPELRQVVPFSTRYILRCMSKKHPTFDRSNLDRRTVFDKEKRISLHTVHARVTHGTRHTARPNLDDDVPRSCPCTGNPELWHAVPFSTRCLSAKNNIFEKKENTKQRLTEKTRVIVLSTLAEKQV